MSTDDMREIWVNGKLVGSIPEMGDQQSMHLAALALMEQQGISPPSGKAEQLTAFGQARSFAKAAKLIYQTAFNKHPYDPYLISPLIVCIAFSVEVYIKAIGRLCGMDLQGHELSPLYDKLPPVIQTDLQALSAAHLSRVKLPPQHIRDALAAMDHAFIQWRYLYEKEHKLQFEVGVAFQLLAALDEVACTLAEVQTRKAPPRPT